ncbi:MAG: TetR/AcrR family transcriptional regulator [Myxococcaceae bacterium]|nr:TetR/AcrR family transcriptional regulator [Myxococcaceae bacterium]
MQRDVEPLSRRDPAARRAKVLEAATRLFAERGYEATSVNDVAAEAAVSIGALYKYFPDKPALLEGVLATFEGQFAEAMGHVHQVPGSHFDKLHAMVEGLFDMGASRPYFFWALTSGTHALRGEREHSSGDAVREQIRRFLEAGIAAGDFRPVDVPRMAAVGFGVVETAMQQCFGPKEKGQHREAWARMVEETLARAVRP